MISSRHYSTIYYISPAGDILWQLGGKNSSFQMGEGTDFYWQHDARWIEEGTKLRSAFFKRTVSGREELIISLFDNAASSWTQSAPRAKGMILVLDMAAMTCELEQDYLPYVDEASPSQGSTRRQPNGDVLNGSVMFLYIRQ
jgi:hypothetical protein